MSCFKKKSSHNMKSCNERIIHGEFHNIKHMLSIYMISYIDCQALDFVVLGYNAFS